MPGLPAGAPSALLSGSHNFLTCGACPIIEISARLGSAAMTRLPDGAGIMLGAVLGLCLWAMLALLIAALLLTD